jgi:hypothetical protein
MDKKTKKALTLIVEHIYEDIEFCEKNAVGHFKQKYLGKAESYEEIANILENLIEESEDKLKC